jgi:hypothetical protein
MLLMLFFSNELLLLDIIHNNKIRRALGYGQMGDGQVDHGQVGPYRLYVNFFLLVSKI